MAVEAIKSGQYEAGVIFHKLLVKHSFKEEKKGKYRHKYFEDIHITPKYSKELLIEAMNDHDRVLLKRGHLGRFFQCNSVPFNKRKRQNVTIKQPNTNVTILDRDQLFSLTSRERKRRRLHGRKRWAEDKKDPNEDSNYITAERLQTSKLCNGVQMRVIKRKTKYRLPLV